MGSEMCIRDRITSFGESIKDEGFYRGIAMIRHEIAKENKLLALEPCLLYTSDAADE